MPKDKKEKTIEPLKSPFQTYIQVAQTLFSDNPDYYSKEGQDFILSFAKYLDSGRVLNAELQMIAMQQARKIDGEVIVALADVTGLEKAREVIAGVYAKHRHGSRKAAH